MDKVIIITGGSSGIGLNTARILTEKGCRVYVRKVICTKHGEIKEKHITLAVKGFPKLILI